MHARPMRLYDADEASGRRSAVRQCKASQRRKCGITGANGLFVAASPRPFLKLGVHQVPTRRAVSHGPVEEPGVSPLRRGLGDIDCAVSGPRSILDSNPSHAP